MSKYRTSAGVWDWSASLNKRKHNEREITNNRWTSGRNTESSCLNDIHTNSLSSFGVLLCIVQGWKEKNKALKLGHRFCICLIGMEIKIRLKDNTLAEVASFHVNGKEVIYICQLLSRQVTNFPIRSCWV